MASEFRNTEAFVKKYGIQVENEIKTRLVNAGHVASGKLFDSIKSKVLETKEGFDIVFKMARYGDYVDKGVSGAGIPDGFNGKIKKVQKSKFYSFGKATSRSKDKERSLKSWMSIQGIPKTAYYPISRSIWIFGIAPTNFFTIPTTRRQKQLEKGIEKNMALDFEQILLKGLK